MYICVAPEKEMFNIYGESLGIQSARALYYSPDVGTHRVYRQSYPFPEVEIWNGKNINENLKLLQLDTLEEAIDICKDINNFYKDNFSPVEYEREGNIND